MMTAIIAAEDAIKVVLTPSMPSDDVIAVIEKSAKVGVRLSKAWQRKHLKALAEEAVKFANYVYQCRDFSRGTVHDIDCTISGIQSQA